MLTHRFRELESSKEEPGSAAANLMRPGAFAFWPIGVWPTHQAQFAELYRVAYEFAQAQAAHERRMRRLAFSVN